MVRLAAMGSELTASQREEIDRLAGQFGVEPDYGSFWRRAGLPRGHVQGTLGEYDVILTADGIAARVSNVTRR